MCKQWIGKFSVLLEALPPSKKKKQVVLDGGATLVRVAIDLSYEHLMNDKVIMTLVRIIDLLRVYPVKSSHKQVLDLPTSLCCIFLHVQSMYRTLLCSWNNASGVMPWIAGVTIHYKYANINNSSHLISSKSYCIAGNFRWYKILYPVKISSYTVFCVMRL